MQHKKADIDRRFSCRINRDNVTRCLRLGYWPASRVSTMKLELLKVVPWTRPSPWALTWLALPISDWMTIIVMGLLATCCPFFKMLTRCSPTSRGMKEIPGRRGRSEVGRGGKWTCEHFYECSTDVIVSHPLQKTRLVAARWCLDACSEQAQIRLINVQGEICCCAQFDLGAPLVVLWVRRHFRFVHVYESAKTWLKVCRDDL